MVTKTRSHESMDGVEELTELRVEIMVMKKDLGALKGLKGEVAKVKKLLKALCANMGDGDPEKRPLGGEEAVGGHTQNSTGEAGTSQPPTGGAEAAPRGAQLHIEPNTVNLGGTGSLGRQVQATQSHGAAGGNGFHHSGPFQGDPFSVGNAIPTFDQPRHIHMGAGVNSMYAEAILKGPRLEMTLFEGDDVIGWLKQYERFYEVSGTPQNQWVNLALAHLSGRAVRWFRGVGILWQFISWAQLSGMMCDRFSEANVHEAVEKMQNVKQHALTVSQYIDKFEE